jgi:TonB-dependent starch-binding outer membrane protein SusC
MKRFHLVFLFIIPALSGFSQPTNVTISGKVVDEQSHGPLAGATVHIKGTTHEVITNDKGEFRFLTGQHPPLSFLVSYVGYQTAEWPTDATDGIVISLRQAPATLSDVVISSGYATLSKRQYTGAAAQISGARLENKPAQSFTQLLDGQAAGVDIVEPTSALNNPPVLRIRGINSISSGIYPLVVVDGVTVFTGSAGGAVGNDPLADLNPADIETIDVLKDASATAIYGSRAANGVLVITTKKGRKGKTRVHYDGWVSFSNPYNLPKLLNATEYVALKNEARTNDGLSPGFALQKEGPDSNIVNTNWYDVAFHTGISQSHNISLSGASDATSYYFSTGYTAQDAFIRNNSFTRKIIRLNIDHKLLESVHIGANISYSNSLNQGPNTGAIPPNSITGATGNSVNTQYIGTEPLARLTYILPPNVLATNPDGSYNINPANGTIGYGANSPSLGVFNAWNLKTVLDLDKNTSENNAFIGNVYAEWAIIRDLKARISYGYDNLAIANTSFLNPYSGDGATAYPNIVGGGAATNANTVLKNTDWTNTLIYNPTFGRNHVKILTGYEEVHKTVNGWGATRTGVTDPYYSSYQGGWSSITPADNIQTESGLVSVFSGVDYDFDRRYLLSANFRRDGLSALATGHKWGNFGGGSAGWNVSAEKFYQNTALADVLSSLKIRGSYGVVGNSSIADFAALSQYSSATYEALATLYFSQAGNTHLKWETSKKTDVGLNLGFWRDRITIDADYYNNAVDGLILNTPQAASAGIPGNSIAANIGSLYNRGIELALNAHVIRTTDFRWDLSLNFSTLKNRVTNLGAGGDIYPTSLTTFGIQNMTRAGYSIGSIFAVPTIGVDPANGERIYLNHANQEVEYNAVNKSFTTLSGTAATAIDNYADGRILGPSLPTWFGGFNNTLTYDQFDLNLGITFSGGNKLYDGTRATISDQRYFNNGTFVENRWTKPGQITSVPKLVWGDNYSTGFSSSNSARVEDGSYIKLKNIALGYTVPLTGNILTRISSIHIYAQAGNLLTITRYKGSDPEVSINGNSINSGKDQNVPPNARVITIGLNAGF